MSKIGRFSLRFCICYAKLIFFIEILVELPKNFFMQIVSEKIIPLNTFQDRKPTDYVIYYVVCNMFCKFAMD